MKEVLNEQVDKPQWDWNLLPFSKIPHGIIPFGIIYKNTKKLND
jgi:hypothetical protein